MHYIDHGDHTHMPFFGCDITGPPVEWRPIGATGVIKALAPSGNIMWWPFVTVETMTPPEVVGVSRMLARIGDQHMIPAQLLRHMEDEDDA